MPEVPTQELPMQAINGNRRQPARLRVFIQFTTELMKSNV
jgi:hypothetical protein